MSIPIDDETFRSERQIRPEEIENGNPGKPQSVYATIDVAPEDSSGGFPDRTHGLRARHRHRRHWWHSVVHR